MEIKATLTFNQLPPLRPLPQSLLQIVRRALSLKLKLSSLQRRRSIRVEQDVAVLEVLFFGTGLQVFLKTVAALGSGDGRDVDAFGEGWSAVGHLVVLAGWLLLGRWGRGVIRLGGGEVLAYLETALVLGCGIVKKKKQELR